MVFSPGYTAIQKKIFGVGGNKPVNKAKPINNDDFFTIEAFIKDTKTIVRFYQNDIKLLELSHKEPIDSI